MATSLSELLSSRPEVTPQIYGYTLPTDSEHTGYIKVGYTDKNDVEERIAEQLHTATVSHETVLVESAMRTDGTCFTDKDVHNRLLRKGIKKKIFNSDTNNEWFKCSVEDVKTAINEIRYNKRFESVRDFDFKMRDEQVEAVEKTSKYFKKAEKEEPNQKPKFLWNAKMRFGKTFATYELAKKMGMKRVLVLTFKPAVESAWQEDLTRHVDFDEWQFVSNKEAKWDSAKIDEQFNDCDKSKPIVVFGSFQDLLGTNEAGGIKAKNEFIHKEDWDMVVFDEYHFGAWRDSAKKLFEKQSDEDVDFDYEEFSDKEANNTINETWLPITSKYYLYLSGTPFRALGTGEFLEDQIFNWTYSQEQEAKENWDKSKGYNPYASLPQMVMLTYKIPDSIIEPAVSEGYDEFDINEFFKAEPTIDDDVKSSVFVYEDYVQKWLDLIQGKGNFVDGLKLGNDKPPMPYSDVTLLNVLTHTLWFLPNVSSCWGMYNLIRKKNNTFFNDYDVVVCAGTSAGIGLDALKPVQEAMGDDPLKTKTITLSCGKLTTGVTVKPWSGIFMLRNLKSPETYFQAAFRVQSPWTIKDVAGNEVILKKECYIFDFALERALKQISDYSMKLSVNDKATPEKKVEEFINFLPVLAFDGTSMDRISAKDVLDITYAGTTATLLAKRWQTALLVHVDNETLKKLQANPAALDALKNLEGFRKLNETIQTIINKSEKIKKLKSKESKPTPKQAKEISEEEKQMKSLRKQVQENLLKLAARIPAFMYLTDYREETIKDVITQIEPELFTKVTGLKVDDFELLCSIGLFDAEKMNQGIFGFRRYESSSLSYAGIDKHEGENIGGWDTVLTKQEYEELYAKQQANMTDFVDIIVPKDEESIKVTVKAPAKVYASGLTDEDVKKWEKILSKVKIGSKVSHKEFGTGTVLGLKDNLKKIVVDFDGKQKTFPFPKAFIAGFLKLVEDK